MDGQYQAETLRRFARAEARRRQWDGILVDAYRYALPNHDPTGSDTRGTRRDVEVYDNTAVNAVQWKKARLHGQLFPPFREWVDFDPDQALDLNENGGDKWKSYVELARKRFHQAIEASNFHIEIDPALGDSCISTGFLMCHAGTPDEPLRFEAVPVSQFVPEEGVDGLIRTVFRRWKVPARQIEVKWPEAKLPDGLSATIGKDPDAGIDVVEALLHDDKTGRCRYEVWLAGGAAEAGEHRIVERNYARSPAVVFRMDKAAGEWMGRGPVLSVLGDIKTANKVVELVLKNASIAVTGIWQADDDGVINLAAITLEPGVIIPKAVGSDGLTPLEAPGRFDVSQLVLTQLQDGIRKGIMGPSLPPDDEGVRTAFEIDVRKAEQQAVELPMGLRLLTELDAPLVLRVLDILQSPAMAGSPYYIPPFEVGGRKINPVPKNPLVRLQDRADAALAQQAYMQAAQAFPDLIAGVVDRAAFARRFLSDNGFPTEHFMTEEKRAEFEAMVRRKMAEQQAAERLAEQQKAMAA